MIETGSILDGKIARIMPFGAFVDLGSDGSGLVHISEISNEYVKDINAVLKVGETVKVKVLGVDEKGRVSLSIKQAEPEKERSVKKPRDKKSAWKKPKGPIRPADIDWSAKPKDDMSFEDKLMQFKQDSDEKMQALKRSADSKRSGGYSRRSGH